MYTLIIGRSYPEKKTNMLGIFEYEQAVAVHKFGNRRTIYFFCDTSSIKRIRKFGYVHFQNDNLDIYGYHIPLGGLPRKILDKIKKRYFINTLKEMIKEQGSPELIHVHFPLLNLSDDIWEFLKSLNRPIVVTEHWSKIQEKKLSSNRLNLLGKIVKEADEFICVGDLLKTSIEELTGTTRHIHVLPNTVSSHFYYENNIDRDNKFRFVAVGRLIKSKRFNLVIEAFTHVFRHNPHVHLTIVGGGPLLSKLKSQIKEIGADDKITMTGFLSRNKTAETVRNSDVFVSASVIETFGVPFIEAMACGKPVIGVKTGVIDKYINGSNGILMDKDDPEGLEDALLNLYKNRDSYEDEFISVQTMRLFNEEVVTNRLIDIYEDCLK